MILIGVLSMLLPAGGAALLTWDNREVIVRVHAGPFVWTGPIYAALVVGALAMCWFLLGLSCIRCRVAELRAVDQWVDEADEAVEASPGRRARAAAQLM